jgi:hypothetical protein
MRGSKKERRTMSALIEWMGGAFSPEQYVFWTRVQCTAWTLADLVIVFYLLRLANLARVITNAKPHQFSYVLFAATLPLSALIPFLSRGSTIFLVELAVTIPHFLIILYVLASDAKIMRDALTRVISRESA